MMYGIAQDGDWKIKKIIAPASYTNAYQIYQNWLKYEIDSNYYCVFIRNDIDNFTATNGTMLVCNSDGDAIGAYIRWYNNGFNGMNQWATNYTLSVDAGDEYYVLYKPKTNNV